MGWHKLVEYEPGLEQAWAYELFQILQLDTLLSTKKILSPFILIIF